jgi:ADP-ribosylglycohydrolase
MPVPAKTDSKSSPGPADRRAGSLVAQALGDAIGFLVEGQHPVLCQLFAREVFERVDPPERGRGSFAFGQYSDDTQLARELALSLVDARGWDPQDFARRIGEIFATDRIVGRGRATEAAAHRLLEGVAWDEAGEPSPSAGNGAAMRAAPAGLRFSDPVERLRVADEQARITHRDPRSRAAAILVADLVADAVAQPDGPRPANAQNIGVHAPEDGCGSALWCERFARRVDSADPALAAGIRRMPFWLNSDVQQAADEITRISEPPKGAAHAFERWHGISPFATPSALYAMFAYARSPTDAECVLETAVAVGGDVDTVAAMAGAMVGARVGFSRLSPRLQRWAERLNDNGHFGLEQLTALAHALE